MARILLAFVVLCAFVIGTAQPTAPPLKLKPGDAIKVVVLGYPEYSADYSVLSDGSVSGVGFGRITASGMTIDQVTGVIKQRLTRYIKEPQVSVVLTLERVQSVFVVRNDPERELLAAPSNPTSGAIPFVPGLDLKQVIAIAQPPGEYDLYETKVYRDGILFKEVNLERLIKGDPAEWNGPMKANDLVTMLPVPMVKVWVLGHVKTPGEIQLRVGATAMQAIARAGGLTDSDLDDVIIQVRRGPSEFQFSARPQPNEAPFKIESGDTVTVQQVPYLKVSIGGLVMTPGVYQVREGTSIAAAIAANAGGPNPDGTLSSVYLLRDGEVTLISALPPKPGEQPMMVKSGDALFVNPNERFVYVFGTVNDPGRKLFKEGEKMFLTDALAAAKGLNERGSYRRVYIVTPTKGTYEIKQVNLDEYLKDGKLSANPELKPGDVVLFGQPKGITIGNAGQILSTILLFNNLVNK